MHTIPKVTSVLSPPTSTPGAAVITDTAGGCAGGDVRRLAAWSGRGVVRRGQQAAAGEAYRGGGKNAFRKLSLIEEEENEYY